MKIIKDGKNYEQRTENSKIKKYSKEGDLLGIFDDIPREIESEYEKAVIIKNHPEDYFEYKITDDNNIIITKLKFPDLCSSIEIPETIKNKKVIGLDEKVFLANETIEYVKIPDTVEFIGDFCFMSATRLKEVTLSKNIKDIPKFCFHLCTSLTNINTENIKQIFSNAFSSANISDINLENVFFIDRDAFNNTKLKRINLLNLAKADEGTFAECENLEYVNIDGSLTQLPDTMFFSCTKLKEVKLGSSICEIGRHAFTFCENLEKINLDNIHLVGFGAFMDTTITPRSSLEINEER